MVTEINSASALPSFRGTKPDVVASPTVSSATKVERLSSGETVAQENGISSESSESLKDLQSTVSNINELVQNTQRSIHFSISEKTGDTIIQVFNKDTDELIREIPSKELQKIAEAIEAHLSEGVLFKASI